MVALRGAVVVVVETSAPKVYPRVTLASASTLSGSAVRTLRGGEALPNMFCLVASSLGHLRSQCSIVCGGVEEIGIATQVQKQAAVAYEKAHRLPTNHPRRTLLVVAYKDLHGYHGTRG